MSVVVRVFVNIVSNPSQQPPGREAQCNYASDNRHHHDDLHQVKSHSLQLLPHGCLSYDGLGNPDPTMTITSRTCIPVESSNTFPATKCACRNVAGFNTYTLMLTRLCSRNTGNPCTITISAIEYRSATMAAVTYLMASPKVICRPVTMTIWALDKCLPSHLSLPSSPSLLLLRAPAEAPLPASFVSPDKGLPGPCSSGASVAGPVADPSAVLVLPPAGAQDQPTSEEHYRNSEKNDNLHRESPSVKAVSSAWCDGGCQFIRSPLPRVSWALLCVPV